MAEPSATPPASPSSESRPIHGIVWMLITGVFFVAVTVSVKQGVPDLPAPMSAFLRYLFGLIFFVPMFGALLREPPTPRQMKLFGLRGLTHSLGVCLWFFAMTRITIAEVTAMNYMTPIYVTLAAAVFLGERLALRRLIAIAFAFTGALIILRPGVREITDGHIAMVFAAIVFAFSYLTAKRMADEMPASTVVAMLSIFVTICLFPMALAVWQWPTPEEAAWIFLIAILATLGHYSMTRAFAAAPVSVTQPVVFTQLIWSVLTGYLLFGEDIDGWVILGGMLIMAAATFIAVREAMLKRAALRG